ncbi:hypothetical protein NJR55_00685 [Idiomarina sp. M1R2S28]|uniref:Uncharacterized protein n=1 Tax=Idiomarina rhizosphaerae TaxID=2961572 RepID=A0A9X2FUY1_9GAMM|nr:hypothetical protein [Idiomarina rhizosphaerae]MCP1338095.1 hypothetical protein [Idiomarina rhizosphaerae]
MEINRNALTQTVTQLANEKLKVAVSEQPISQAEKGLDKDVYHKNQKISSDEQVTYDRPFTIEAHKSESALIDKMTNTITFGELPKLLRSMQKEYQIFMANLQKDNPSLANKDWGFSIDSDDKLVVSGNITENEKEYLESELNSNTEILELAKEVPDIFIKGQEYDRGYDGKGQYWGKYDVTQENFKDIIDIKEILDKSYTTNRGEIFKGNFDIFKYQSNLQSQLSGKAEAKYSY